EGGRGHHPARGGGGARRQLRGGARRPGACAAGPGQEGRAVPEAVQVTQSKASRIIGIDLGTTNSSVATVGAGGEPAIIPNKRGNRTTPSVVTLIELAGELRFLIGEIAQRTATTEPTNTVHGFKRFIGRRFDNPEVQT